MTDNIPLEDPGNEPVIYAEAMTGVCLLQGNLHLTFEVVKQANAGVESNTAEYRRRVVLRVVIPLVSADRAQAMIAGFIARMRTMSAQMAPVVEHPERMN